MMEHEEHTESDYKLDEMRSCGALKVYYKRAGECDKCKRQRWYIYSQDHSFRDAQDMSSVTLQCASGLECAYIAKHYDHYLCDDERSKAEQDLESKCS